MLEMIPTKKSPPAKAEILKADLGGHRLTVFIAQVAVSLNCQSAPITMA
jgi:hypothetical protein